MKWKRAFGASVGRHQREVAGAGQETVFADHRLRSRFRGIYRPEDMDFDLLQFKLKSYCA